MIAADSYSTPIHPWYQFSPCVWILTQHACPSPPHWILRHSAGSSCGGQEGGCCSCSWHCATHVDVRQYLLPGGCIHLWQKWIIRSKWMTQRNPWLWGFWGVCGCCELTLAPITSIYSRSIPRFHSRVHTWNSSGKDLWQLTGLLRICHFWVIVITQLIFKIYIVPFLLICH